MSCMRPVFLRARRTALLLLAASLSVAGADALGATCTSNVATGNWNTPGTWSCGHVPLDTDDVVIQDGHTITLNTTTNVLASLTLNAGTTGGKLTLTGTSGNDICLGGNLVNNGTIDLQASTGTNTLYLAGANLTSTFSGTGTWLLDDLDLNGSSGACGTACTGACKVELSGSPNLQFGDSAPFAGNSATFTFNAAGNATATVTPNRTGTQAIATTGITYPNLVLEGNNTKTPGSGTLAILGGLTVTSGVTFNANSNDPTINVTGSVSVDNGATYTASNSGVTSIGGSLANSGTYTGNNAAVNLAGNFSNSGSFTSGSGAWTFNGGTAQSITGAATFQNLVLSNGNGLTLTGGDVTVSTLLTLSSGKFATGANNLIASANCPGSVSRSSGYVVGNLRLTVPATNPVTCTFPVGDANNYAPVSITKTGTNAGTLTGATSAGDHTDTTAGYSGIDANKSVNRTWTLTGGTLASATPYSATFQFCSATGSGCGVVDTDAGATPANFAVVELIANTWTPVTVGTRTATTTSATGLSAWGTFVVGETAAVLCFVDSFNRADGAPGSNWAVGGSFSPQIASNRLQLTQTAQETAAWATLQRTFPGAGNKITVDFDHYAYGGTPVGNAADGIGIILSNAAISPVVGAFGGSMGYAPKGQTPVSDCIVVGGCPGFTGGWLGVAIDEYGNFSTNTEGRYGGSPTRIPQSVAVRGSGSGMSGYRFLTGTGTLSPAVDGNGAASPPHHYRITVDHSDSVHAWVSVERDTTNGGSSYSTLLGCASGQNSGCTAFDAKDPGNSQDPVPANWILSFTGATGANTNFHEIDALRICTAQGIQTPAVHHVRLEYSSTACTGSGDPTTVTIKACADASCSSLYLGDVEVNLAVTGSAIWSFAPATAVTVSGGQTTVTLTDNTAQSVTLSGSVTGIPAAAVLCHTGAAEASCASLPITFAACIFDVIETGAASFTPIYTKLAGTPFNLDLLSLSGTSRRVCTVEIVNAASGSTCSAYPSLGNTTTALPSTFAAGQRRSFAFNHASAARNARIRVGYIPFASTCPGTPAYSCSSDNFAIRPTTFAVDSNGTATQAGSTGTPKLKAGSDTFSLRATALAGYDGTPKLNLASGYFTTTLSYLGSLGSVVFPAASAANGVATASGFTYSEVGNFSLAQNAVYDDGFTAVDSTKTQPDCTSDFTNDTAVNNAKSGCMFGSAAAGPFGRFYPHHFAVAGALVGRSDLTARTTGTIAAASSSLTVASASGIVAGNSIVVLGAGASGAALQTSVNAVVGATVLLGAAAATAVAGAAVYAWPATDGFSYMDEPMLLLTTVTALNAGEAVTRNYAGSYAKLDAATLGTGANWMNVGCAAGTQCFGFGAIDGTTTPLTPRLAVHSAVAGPASAWVAGVGSFATHLMLTRPVTATPDATWGPYATVNLGVAPQDSDGVTVPGAASTDAAHRVNLDADADATGERVLLATTGSRYGRLRLMNAYGSDLLPIRVPVRAEYFGGASWLPNTADNLTPLAASTVALGNLTLPAGSGLALQTPPAGVACVPAVCRLQNGVATLVLTPGTAGAGWFDMVLNLGSGTTSPNSCLPALAGSLGGAAPSPALSYLLGNWCGTAADRAPNARVKFGASKAPYIYLRERY